MEGVAHFLSSKDFLSAFAMTFWAEMGDKTQLLALALATRYTLREVLLGIAWATAAVHIVSVGLGHWIAKAIPLPYLELISALSFLAFAWWTWRGEEEEELKADRSGHPILIVGIAFFLAELGDKTMLTAVVLATTSAWMAVWLGSTLGMILSDGIAVFVGKWLGRSIPARTVKVVSVALFLGFAFWTGFQAWRHWRGA